MAYRSSNKTTLQLFHSTIWMTLGAFIAAFALEVILIPNQIIDGGVIGISILISKFLGPNTLYPLAVLLNLPFCVIAYRQISRDMVVQMCIAVLAFAGFGFWIGHSDISAFAPYQGDLLEIVVIGGLLLGLGVGLIIRSGGCLDGFEILALIIHRKYSLSVGNVVLFTNTIIFIAAGLIFNDWHSPIQSLITFFVVIKIMDMVIMGVDEMKSIMIFSRKPQEVSRSLMHELGLGLTILKAKGGFSGDEREVLFLMAERLQLSVIKSLVHGVDPQAFLAITNLHEVSSNNVKGITNKKP